MWPKYVFVKNKHVLSKRIHILRLFAFSEMNANMTNAFLECRKQTEIYSNNLITQNFFTYLSILGHLRRRC